MRMRKARPQAAELYFEDEWVGVVAASGEADLIAFFNDRSAQQWCDTPPRCGTCLRVLLQLPCLCRPGGVCSCGSTATRMLVVCLACRAAIGATGAAALAAPRLLQRLYAVERTRAVNGSRSLAGVTL